MDSRLASSSSSSAASSSSLLFSQDDERLDLDSVTAFVNIIDQHINSFPADPKAWKLLKSRCISKLKVPKLEPFEFSEQSMASNLYWGIESIEAATQTELLEEKTSRLQNCEKLLQVPASLDENGFTAGIPNHFFVSCSYFYLSIVRKLQGDKWQVAFHFLQALVVSPRLIHKELAPQLCHTLFVSCMKREKQKLSARRISKSQSLKSFDEDEVSEVMKRMAKRYKGWIMYYQIMSCGQSQKHCGGRGTGCSTSSNVPGDIMIMKSRSQPLSASEKHGCKQRTDYSLKKEAGQFEKIHPLDSWEKDNAAKESKDTSGILKFKDNEEATNSMKITSPLAISNSSTITRLKDLLTDSQSDTPHSLDLCDWSSLEGSFSEKYAEGHEVSLEVERRNAEGQQSETCYQNWITPWSSIGQITTSSNQASNDLACQKMDDKNALQIISTRLSHEFTDVDSTALESRDRVLVSQMAGYIEQQPAALHILDPDDQQHYDFTSVSLNNSQFYQVHLLGNTASIKDNKLSAEIFTGVFLNDDEIVGNEQVGALEKLISKLCFSEDLECREEYTVDIATVYEMLNRKKGLKYSLLKDIILDRLLMAISNSKKEQVIRASVCILSSLVSRNKSIVADIKRKGLQLYDLVTALKRNIHEAAILIYFISPSPTEIKTLELLPCLLEVCTSKRHKTKFTSIIPTPPAASMMIIEVLVTAFDCTTNNTHLAAISSPTVLSVLLDVPRNDSLEEFISLAAILVRCMRYDGQCRKYISHFAQVAPFVSLLHSNQRRGSIIALEFFHELLQMPRSYAIAILQQIQQEGGINNMCALLIHIQSSEPEYKLLAASLLLQLDMLEEASGKFAYRQVALQALLESVACEENPVTQALSASILSNIGGTYSWIGEPCTGPLLAKKTGLTSLQHKNMIKNYDLLDQNLQEAGTDTWCSRLARRVISNGIHVFQALEKGIKSNTKRVSRDCLTAIAWLGCEIVKGPDDLRYAACEILLSSMEQYVHPGLELEERLLACLCIYHYTSGRGMKKLFHFSEGVRESLRRLSSITWMAEELLKVADYLQPNKWRISCVHTQVLEASQNGCGAVTALIYYQGQLYSGYADGSIKVWDIKGHTAVLAREMKEHKRAVTCFSLFEPGNCLLSGSADKTIRIWQMDQGSLKCVDAIRMRDSIHCLETYGKLIFATTLKHKMKVIDASKNARSIVKNKSVKCIRVTQGKVYAGCTDSSIQELAVSNNWRQEIKATSKNWILKNKPINSIALYKDWLYSGSVAVEASNIKDWRLNKKPQISVVPEKGGQVLGMEVVEDFIYLFCSGSTSSLQIWLRGTLHKVGRLSAGSKITSLLSANDMILCGTETGLIKGWIPL